LAEGLAAGDSVAVAGVCLTVCAVSGSVAEFEVGAETLAKTTLPGLAAGAGVGARVNLERPLRPSDGLDGHMVLGHVDGVAEVKSVRTVGQHVIELVAPQRLMAQIVEKGSVCIDGVSLTVAGLTERSFSVALIGETLARTTLGELKAGAKVNIETDIIGKYVLRHLSAMTGQAGQAGPTGGLTLDKLSRAGFL